MIVKFYAMKFTSHAIIVESLAKLIADDKSD